jgi:competence protein ComEC
MKQKLHKILFGLLILVLVLLGLISHEDLEGLNITQAEKEVLVEGSEDDLLKVHFLDVGQGDSIYIRTPNEQDILIDGGPSKDVLAELGKVMPFWDRDIDVMILTHPHSDHVTGLVEVLKRFDVKTIYYTGATHTAPDYLAWLQEIKDQDLNLKIVQNFFEIDFGNDVVLQFLYPQTNINETLYSDLNNTSIVNRLVYGDTEFLFTGDAEEKVEQNLLDSKIKIYADVLKAGHHASTTSSSEEFLQAVDPQVVVIQSGEGNQFGHPHLRTLNKFERYNVDVLRTDLLGQISIYSNGEDLFY